MDKQLILIRGRRDEAYSDFCEQVLESAGRLTDDGITSCKVTLTCEPPPRGAVIPYSKEKIALVTVSGERNGALSSALGRLAAHSGFIGAFRTETAVPVGYEKTWADGEKTPGLGLLTLFRRKPDVEYADFLYRWHNGHTPLSLEIHPLWNYVRNVVVEKTAGDGIWFDAIVEEHCRTRKDLLSPVCFFGGILKMPRNMYRVNSDVRGFIDYSSIEPYCVEEFWLKS